MAHGGVAVVFRRAACNMSKIDLPNDDNYEILVTAANMPGYKEKLITIACYLPPNYPVARGRGAVQYIEDLSLIHI